MRTCPQCKIEFTPKSKSQKYCNPECKKIAYKDKYDYSRKEPVKTFPKFIDDNGVEHQLNFYPEKSPLEFERFKANLKET